MLRSESAWSRAAKVGSLALACCASRVSRVIGWVVALAAAGGKTDEVEDELGARIDMGEEVELEEVWRSRVGVEPIADEFMAKYESMFGYTALVTVANGYETKRR